MRDINMSSIQTIDRAIDVLETFTHDNPFLTIEEISNITSIPKNTCYRILYTLERRGLIKFDQETLKYQPGLRLIEFGYLQDVILNVQKESEDLLEELFLQTKETVLMAIREDDDTLFYTYKKENKDGLKVSTTVGLRRNIFFGVLGLSILAFYPESKQERLLKQIEPHSPNAVTDPTIVRNRLKTIKQDLVYVQSNETTTGVIGISSPILNMNGEPMAAIGVIGPTFHFNDEETERVKKLVKECSMKISNRMGYKFHSHLMDNL